MFLRIIFEVFLFYGYYIDGFSPLQIDRCLDIYPKDSQIYTKDEICFDNNTENKLIDTLVIIN